MKLSVDFLRIVFCILGGVGDMKLNTQLLCEALNEAVGAQRKGLLDPTLHLGRPEFYLGSDRALRADHLYLMQAERLPQRPVVEKGAAIVVVGSSVNLPYYLERCSVVQIPQRTDLQLVFNLLTRIYDRYDGWMEQLQTIAATTASVREMIAASLEIFGNPIFVLNSNFHFLARSDDADIPPTQLKTDSSRQVDADELGIGFLSKFLEQKELSIQERKPILINILDSSTLSVNLFLDGTYSGCLTIDYRRRRHRESDDVLAEALARMLELALRKYSDSGSEKSAMRKTLQDLVSGFPIDVRQRRILDAAQLGSALICIKLKFGSRLEQLPMGYMCSLIEKDFASSIAFAYDGAIVAFLSTQSLRQGGLPVHEALQQKLLPQMHSMRFDVGISSPFSDVFTAQLAYLQACSALENGMLFAPGAHFHCFSRYALTELITNALGKLPLELYYSEGVQNLLRHDAESPVSYLETLKIYLDNNMSASKTAAALYLNRSTLLERIERVKRELNSDLQDADERLLYQILLKAMQTQKQIQLKTEP